MIEIDPKDLDFVLAEPELIVVQFYAEGCKPCRQMATILENIEAKCAEAEVFISFYMAPAWAFQQRFNFSGVPTVIAFRDQAERARLVGGHDQKDVENWLMGCMK
jgi:thioredoxin 1